MLNQSCFSHTLSMPSISIQNRSSLPKVKQAKAILNITSMPSTRKLSITRQASGCGSVVENSVKNQDEAYLKNKDTFTYMANVQGNKPSINGYETVFYFHKISILHANHHEKQDEKSKWQEKKINTLTWMCGSSERWSEHEDLADVLVWGTPAGTCIGLTPPLMA